MYTDRRFLQGAEARAVPDEEHTIEVSFSSTYDQGERWYGIEVLSHDPKHVRLDRLESGAAVLLDHMPERHAGTTSAPRIDGEKGRARVRFGTHPLGAETELMVAEGIKRDTSVGYVVHHISEMGKRSDGSDYVREVPADLFDSSRRALEQRGARDREAFLRTLDQRLGPVSRAKGAVPKFLVDDWEPTEISFVAIPFDPQVGVDRALPPAGASTAQPKETPVSDTTTAAPAANPAQPDIRVIEGQAQAAERQRVTQIQAIGAAHGLQDMANRAIADGTALDHFRATVLDKLVEAGKLRPAPETADIGLTQRERKAYSVVRLMHALLEPNDRGAQAAAAFEIECSVAARKVRPVDESQRDFGAARAVGYSVPSDVLTGPVGFDRTAAAEAASLIARAQAAARRDLTVGTANAGGNLVATDLLAASFIDLLRNRMVLGQLGVTMLDGLVGNVAIPSQTAGGTTYWVTEGNAPTESQLTVGQVTLTPKTVGMFTDYSRKTLLQTTPAIEMLVRSDLAAGIALEIDRAGVAGSGTSPEPRGVINTAGIGSVAGGTNGAAPTYVHMLALEEAVALANADIGNTALLTNPKMRYQLKKTEEFATTNGRPVWQGNEVNGYRAIASNQVPSNLTKGTASGVCSAIVFGNWSDLLVGMWGGLDLILDPYALATSGGRRIVALQDVDTAVRRAASFAAMLDALRT